MLMRVSAPPSRMVSHRAPSWRWYHARGRASMQADADVLRREGRRHEGEVERGQGVPEQPPIADSAIGWR